MSRPVEDYPSEAYIIGRRLAAILSLGCLSPEVVTRGLLVVLYFDDFDWSLEAVKLKIGKMAKNPRVSGLRVLFMSTRGAILELIRTVIHT